MELFIKTYKHRSSCYCYKPRILVFLQQIQNGTSHHKYFSLIIEENTEKNGSYYFYKLTDFRAECGKKNFGWHVSGAGPDINHTIFLNVSIESPDLLHKSMWLCVV